MLFWVACAQHRLLGQKHHEVLKQYPDFPPSQIKNQVKDRAGAA